MTGCPLRTSIFHSILRRAAVTLARIVVLGLSLASPLKSAAQSTVEVSPGDLLILQETGINELFWLDPQTGARAAIDLSENSGLLDAFRPDVALADNGDLFIAGNVGVNELEVVRVALSSAATTQFANWRFDCEDLGQSGRIDDLDLKTAGGLVYLIVQCGFDSLSILRLDPATGSREQVHGGDFQGGFGQGEVANIAVPPAGQPIYAAVSNRGFPKLVQVWEIDPVAGSQTLRPEWVFQDNSFIPHDLEIRADLLVFLLDGENTFVGESEMQGVWELDPVANSAAQISRIDEPLLLTSAMTIDSAGRIFLALSSDPSQSHIEEINGDGSRSLVPDSDFDDPTANFVRIRELDTFPITMTIRVPEPSAILLQLVALMTLAVMARWI